VTGKTVGLKAAVQELLSADELLKGLCGHHPLGVELHLPLRVLLEVKTTSVLHLDKAVGCTQVGLALCAEGHGLRDAAHEQLSPKLICPRAWRR
jgi:hypothetical protein